MTASADVPLTTGLPAQAGSGAAIPYERFLDCVHCGLCTSACPTYLETGDENNSPRGRIYLMRAVTDGRLELTPAVTRHLDLCLDCRSCETACPSGVQYGRLIEPFRVAMHSPKPGEPVKRDWFRSLILYGLFPYAQRLRWALWPARIMQKLGLDLLVEKAGLNRLLPQRLQRMQRLLPRLQARPAELPKFLPAIGPKRGRVALFTGCVADAMFPQVNWATAQVLQQNGCDVLIPRSQACCGAIHYHSGAGQPALELALTNERAFNIEDLDAVIVNVAGCGSMLKDYGHMAEEVCGDRPDLIRRLSHLAGKFKDVNEYLAELGPVVPQQQVPEVVTYHDACHLCHAQQIRSQPRQLLDMIPGLKVLPLAESEICCGAAGSYNLTEPEMADRLGRRKVGHILNTGAKCVVSANAGCTLQIQAMLRASGHADIPVVHPMELLAKSYGLTPPKSGGDDDVKPESSRAMMASCIIAAGLYAPVIFAVAFLPYYPFGSGTLSLFDVVAFPSWPLLMLSDGSKLKSVMSIVACITLVIMTGAVLQRSFVALAAATIAAAACSSLGVYGTLMFSVS